MIAARRNAALTVAAIAAAIAVLSLCLILYVRTVQSQQFREQTSANCMAIERLKDQLRIGYEDRLRTVAANVALDPAQRTLLVAFYQRQLKRFAAIRC